MTTPKPERDLNVRRTLRYDEHYDEYTIQLVHRRRPWWLLLLLLPLLLLIQCRKDVTVHTLEPSTDAPIAGQEVTMSYEAHFVWDDGRFFPTDTVELTQTSDSTGTAVFRDLRCSVYSYIFHCMSQARYRAESRCHLAADTLRNFHYVSDVTLYMEPRREDLHILLLDLETGDPLPDATLTWRYRELGKELVDSGRADGAGIVTIPSMRVCGFIDTLRAGCYGYADTVATRMRCGSLIVAVDSTAMRLRPLKEQFTFFVKDKETRQPIAEAIARVTLTRPAGSQESRQVKTSIDGRGIAVYDDAFVRSVIAIRASKIHYGDGDLEGGPWTVDRFRQLPDSQRVVWLIPEPFAVEFVNVDSITGRPVAGALNRIRITDPSGNVTEEDARSNRNGVFRVKAKEGSRVEIISESRPVYRDKHTVIDDFRESKGCRIPMSPDMGRIEFRTVKDPTGAILPNCDLTCRGSISGHLQPENSGSGEFSVMMRLDETLSIVASRAGYTTNYTKVKDATYNELFSSPQQRRDIPLRIDLPPCNGGTNVPKGDAGPVHQASYNMGQEQGTGGMWLDFYGEADELTVYDGVGTSGRIIFGPELIANKRTVSFSFTQGAVTVVIRSADGSSWEYEVKCP